MKSKKYIPWNHSGENDTMMYFSHCVIHGDMTEDDVLRQLDREVYIHSDRTREQLRRRLRFLVKKNKDLV
jgi:hypothetical protein